MALLEQWRADAYNENQGKEKLQKLWAEYFKEEKEIYAKLLKNPDEVVKGTVKELAEKYGVTRECFRYRFKKYLTGLVKKEQKKQDIQNAANTGFFL